MSPSSLSTSPLRRRLRELHRRLVLRSFAVETIRSHEFTDDEAAAAIRAALNGHAAKAERLFAADVTAGRVPGRRRVMAALKVGDAKAKLVQAHLRNLASPTE